MISYAEIKNWFQQKENKDKLLLGLCFILTFFVGFGTGSYTREIRRDTYKTPNNYTTQTAKKPTIATKTAAAPVPAITATSSAAAGCVIKGNISSSGKKIYHIPGGAYYNIVKPEQCFNTEAEAQAAGFVKSSR